MTAPYSGNENTYNSEISIFTAMDLVLGGTDGASNVPVIELADNSAHLKKFKGTVLTGSGAPSDAVFPTNFVIDGNTNSNVLYLDQLTGSFWQRTGTNTWTNIGKGAILNVKGVRLNNAGDDADTVYLKYNKVDNNLELRNHADSVYADLRVGTLTFDAADGSSEVISQFVDKEILILSKIANASENDNGFYSVKYLIDQTGVVTDVDIVNDRFYVSVAPTVIAGDFIQISGISQQTGEHINKLYKVQTVDTVGPNYYIGINPSFSQIESDTGKTGETGSYSKDNAAQLKWDNGNSRFELRHRDGTLLPINLSSFFINGIPVEFTANRVVTRTSEFDALFNHITNATFNECHLRTPESFYIDSVADEYIYIKKNVDQVDGSYTLNSIVVIEGHNVKIEFAPGVTIKFADDVIGEDICFRYRDNTDLPVYNYSSGATPNNFFQFLSKYFYFVNGDDSTYPSTTTTPSIEVGDRIFPFSSDYTIQKKYTVATHEKDLAYIDLDPDLRKEPVLIGAFDVAYKKIGSNDEVFLAFLESTSPSVIIKIRKFQIDFDAKTADLKTPNVTVTVDWVPDEIKIITGSSTTQGVVVFSRHTSTGEDLGYAQFKLADCTLNGNVHYTDAADVDKDNLYGINGCIINQTNLYIVGNQASDSKVCIFGATISSSISGGASNTDPVIINQMSTNQDVGVPMERLGCITDGTLAYVSWGFLDSAGSGSHYMVLSTGTTAGTWSNYPISGVGQGYAGIYSDIAIAPNPWNSGSELVHVAYTTGIDGFTKQSINVVIADADFLFTSYGETTITTGLTGVDFSSLNLYHNTTNIFQNCHQFTVSAVRGSGPSILHNWTYLNNFSGTNVPSISPSNNTSYRGKITWTGDTRDTTLNKAILVGANNDGCFYTGDDSIGDNTIFFQFVPLVQTLQISETIASGVTADILLSNDYIENCEIINLKIDQQGTEQGPINPYGYYSYIEMNNSINCKYSKLAVLNGKYRNLAIGSVFSVIDSYSSTTLYRKCFHALVEDVWIDNTNTIVTSYFKKFSYTEFRNFYLGQTSAPTKQFDTCTNISISGVINNGDVIFGTGDYDY